MSREAIVSRSVVRLVIPGPPVAWARARRRGGRYFTAPAQAEYAERVRQAWLIAGRPRLPDGSVLAVRADFHLARPASHYATGRNAGQLRRTAPAWPLGGPDVDNLLKGPLDALNGLAFDDDGQIGHAQVFRRYAGNGREPGTVLALWPFAQLYAEERAA